MEVVEVWKDVIGYEGYYEVSNLGNVKSVRKNRLLTPCSNTGGYLGIKFCVNYKERTLLVHRLVVESFLGGFTEEEPHTNHINCIRTDNRAINLERCNRSYNNKYAYSHGNKEPVMMVGLDNPSSRAVVMLDLQGRYIKTFEFIKKAKEEIGCVGSLRTYKVGKTICSTKGYIFMYKDEYNKNKKEDGSIEIPKCRIYNDTRKRTSIQTKKLEKVVQFSKDGEFIKIFDSVMEAERKIGKKGIRDVCRKRVYRDKDGGLHCYETCGGFRWEYLKNYAKNKN